MTCPNLSSMTIGLLFLLVFVYYLLLGIQGIWLVYLLLIQAAFNLLILALFPCPALRIPEEFNLTGTLVSGRIRKTRRKQMRKPRLTEAPPRKLQLFSILKGFSHVLQSSS